jgi:hypothetical protein
MRLLVIASLLQVVAAMAAVLIAKRREEHRPVAAFLSVAVLANLVALLGVVVLGPPTLAIAPLSGIARFVGHVRQGLYLVWPFGFAAMFAAVFARRHIWVFPPAYVVTIAVLVLGYPTIGGEVLRQVYFGIELAAIIVAFGVLIPWVGRREWPTVTHVAAILLLSGEVGVLFGPWHRDIFAGWDMGMVMYAITYGVIALLQGVVLWEPSKSS